MRTKKVQLSDENVEWFEITYGKEASISWALDLLLSKFRELHTIAPIDYASIAATQLNRDIEEEKV